MAVLLKILRPETSKAVDIDHLLMLFGGLLAVIPGTNTLRGRVRKA